MLAIARSRLELTASGRGGGGPKIGGEMDALAVASSHAPESTPNASRFIAVRLLATDSAPEVLVCPSQNDNEEFAAALKDKCRDAGGLQLLDALRLVLLNELYDAAFRLFDWLDTTAAAPAFKFEENSFAQLAFDFLRHGTAVRSRSGQGAGKAV
jgi:hypothetical protein